MRIRVKKTSYVYDHYLDMSLRLIHSAYKHYYKKWAFTEDIEVRINAWSYVKALVAVARERGAFDEKTWEVRYK